MQLQLNAEHDTIRLQTLNITRLPKSLRELNAFTFSEKGVIHYVAFVLAVSIPIFIIVTFVACFRMRDLKHKKLWLAFVLFGVSGFALNWTTGGVAIKILSIQLLGAGFTMASQWAPLMLKVSVPLGAILFWVLRQSGQLALKSEQPVEDSHPGDR